MDTHLLEQARQLGMQEQLELVEALRGCIASQNGFPDPTDAQPAELDRRVADLEASPDDVIAWSHDESLQRFKRAPSTAINSKMARQPMGNGRRQLLIQ